ncbi:hypothetical protein HZB69_00270 [Candidatus Amesbacteria bacterium]|nr:hypothetical protein [Candidatus Amesbacteria bacterium]
MTWLDDSEINPENFDCRHPDRVNKNFSPEKVARCCLIIRHGKPCPFLIPLLAREGREDDSELFLKNTIRTRK